MEDRLKRALEARWLKSQLPEDLYLKFFPKYDPWVEIYDFLSELKQEGFEVLLVKPGGLQANNLEEIRFRLINPDSNEELLAVILGATWMIKNVFQHYKNGVIVQSDMELILDYYLDRLVDIRDHLPQEYFKVFFDQEAD